MRLRTLIVDDSAADAELLVLDLRRHGFQTEWVRVDTADGLRAALDDGQWDIAVVDFVIPGFGGLEALGILRARAPELPAISVSGNVGEEYAVAAMRAGAKDYVRKDSLSRLVPAIERELADAAKRREVETLELALRDAEIRAQTLFLTMEQGVAYQDADGRIVAANPAAMRILGLSWDQINSRTPLDPLWQTVREDGSPFPGDEHPPMVSLRTGRPTRGVVMGIAVGGVGERRWVLVDAVPEFRPGAAAPYRVFTTFTDITERKQAEAALRESEAHLRALLQASSDVVYRMNADWSEMRELFGRNLVTDATAPNGTWLQRYVHPDDQDRVMAAIGDAIRGKHAVEIEHRAQGGRGNVGWLFSRAVPILDANGHVVEWFGMAANITEKKRLQAELERMSLLLRAVVDNLPSLVSVKEVPSLRYLLFNRTAERLTGCRESDLIGQTAAAVWPGASTTAFERADRIALSSDTGSTAVEWIAFRQGEERLFATRRLAIPDSSGRPAYLLGVSEDITARTVAEADLREKIALLDLAHDAIIVRDREDRIRFWNRGAERTYGFSAAEAMGRTSRELLHPEFPVPRDAIESTLRTTGSWAGELTQRRCDGSTVFVASRWSAQRAPDGTPIGTLEINRDITAKKLAEEQRDQLRDLLGAVFEQADIGIAVVDCASGRVVEANPAFRRISGLKPDAVGRATWMSVTHPDDVPDQRAGMARLAAGELARFLSTPRFVHADGSIVRGQMSVVPLARPDGTATEHIAVLRDVLPDGAAAPRGDGSPLH